MDLVKLMILNLCVFTVLALAATRSDAALFDMSEHSGIIRGSDGNYVRISPNGSMSSLTSNTQLALVEKPNIPTSKGVFPVEINRTASVDLTRVGKAVTNFAKKVGPLSMALAAVDLICELSSICKTNEDEWANQQNDYASASGSYSSCEEAIGLQAGQTFPNCDVIKNQYSGLIWYRAQTGSPPAQMGCTHRGSVGWTYTATAWTCNNFPTINAPLTENDWSAAAPKLNDQRFVPHLHDAGEDVPALAPSIQSAPITKEVSKTTTTNRDANGNVTGTTETKTEVQISDGTDPTLPNSLTVNERNTVTNYDVNNNVVSSTTNVVNQEKPAPQEIKIDFDNTTDTPLENYSVPSSFAYTSWGSGTCPADRSVSYHYGTLNLTFEPACDFAVAMNPAILAVAGFLAMFIIAGVRNND